MQLISLSDISLVSSTVSGSTYGEYNPATTYAAGNKIKLSFESDGVTPIFPVLELESLAGGNVGNYPLDYPDKWSNLGAENRCKMFDSYGSTQTIDTSDITYVISANMTDTVGLFGLYGTLVTLTLKVSGATIKTETIDLRTIMPDPDWYSYFCTWYGFGRTTILWQYPLHATNATLEITITLREGEARCGKCGVGEAIYLGASLYGIKTPVRDYSIKAEDGIGTYLSPGAYASDIDVQMRVPNTDYDYVRLQLIAVRGAESILDANNPGIAYESLIICGFPGDFYGILERPVKSIYNLEWKGLI